MKIAIIKNIIILVICFILPQLVYSQLFDATNEAELRSRILAADNTPGGIVVIRLIPPDGEIVITQELPTLSGSNFIEITASEDTLIKAGPNYNGRLIIIKDNSSLTINSNTTDITIKGFDSQESGGVFLLKDSAYLHLNNLIINGIKSSSDGGVIRAEDNSTVKLVSNDFSDIESIGQGGVVFGSGSSRLYIFNSLFDDTRAGTLGGAISLTENAEGSITNSRFDNPFASEFGSIVNFNSTSELTISNSQFRANSKATTVLFENVMGQINIYGSSFNGPVDYYDSTGGIDQYNNLYGDYTFGRKAGVLLTKDICNDFGSGAFTSSGYNISFDNSCNLNNATDLVNTDPRINTTDDNGIISLQANSQAIDSGPVEMFNHNNKSTFKMLPCGYKDIRGLGRPQDADGDGVFECDRGSYEVQGGLDLTNAQSGLYFDVDRSGEGIIVEMLGNSTALVTMFTYNPNKTDLMWFIGIGKIVGNSIVIDELQRTSGGVFGSAFDADAIVRTNIGGMSIIFSDCNSKENPGRLVFEAEFEFANELENLLVKNKRLSQLLACTNQSQTNSMTGRSGSFYDSQRSGEGVFVEVLSNGQAVVIFYTYTPDGKQFWFLSSDVQINGNTITANMVYPASTTGFGSEFNPSEVDLQPWGTIILEYQPGCNAVNISYNSTVNGFGSGNLNYTRLTQPAGTTCDL